MKKSILNLVILFLLFLSACSTPTNLLNRKQPNNYAPVSGENIDGAKESKVSPDASQVWSDAPLSSGILISRTDTLTEKAEIYLIDPANGLPIASAKPLPMGGYFSSIRTLDAKTLVAIAYLNTNNSDGLLHFIDLTLWQDTSIDFTIDGYVGLFNFSPDGKYLSFVTWKNGSIIYLLDLQTKEIVGQRELKDKFAKMHFTSDGSGLMVYMNRWDSTKHPDILPSVIFLGVPDLKIRWGKVLEGVKQGYFANDGEKNTYQPEQGLQYDPGIAFSSIEDKLFVIHADENRLTIVDFANQSLNNVEIVPKLSWFDRLLWMDAQPVKAKMLNGTVKSAVVSPDGVVVYVTGITAQFTQVKSSESEIKSVPLGLQIIDAKNGTEIGHFDTSTQSLSLTPDGRLAILNGFQDINSFGESFTKVFDTQTKEMKTLLYGASLQYVRSLGGEPYFVSQDTTPDGHQKISVYNLNFKELISFEPTKYYLNWMIETPGW